MLWRGGDQEEGPARRVCTHKQTYVTHNLWRHLVHWCGCTWIVLEELAWAVTAHTSPTCRPLLQFGGNLCIFRGGRISRDREGVHGCPTPLACLSPFSQPTAIQHKEQRVVVQKGSNNNAKGKMHTGFLQEGAMQQVLATSVAGSQSTAGSSTVQAASSLYLSKWHQVGY